MGIVRDAPGSTSAPRSRTSHTCLGQMEPLGGPDAVDGPYFAHPCIRDHLVKLEAFKLAGLDWMHSRVLKSLAEVISDPLAILFQKLSEVLGNWKKAHMVSTFKEGGGSMELQISQPGLDTCNDNEANPQGIYQEAPKKRTT